MFNKGIYNHSSAYARMFLKNRKLKNLSLPNSVNFKIMRNETFMNYLTVGSYNLNRFPKTEQSASLFLKFLFFYSPTVLSLQEVVGKSYIKRLISHFNKNVKDVSYNVFSSANSYANTHQTILSRRTLENIKFYDLENIYRNPRELKSFRFPIAFSFSTSGYSFTVVNVHFPYSRKKNRLDIIRYLFTIISDFYHNISQTYYLIIAGDFNLPFRSFPSQIQKDYYTIPINEYFNEYDSIIVLKNHDPKKPETLLKLQPVLNPTAFLSGRAEHLKNMSDHFPKLARLTK